MIKSPKHVGNTIYKTKQCTVFGLFIIKIKDIYFVPRPCLLVNASSAIKNAQKWFSVKKKSTELMAILDFIIFRIALMLYYGRVCCKFLYVSFYQLFVSSKS